MIKASILLLGFVSVICIYACGDAAQQSAEKAIKLNDGLTRTVAKATGKLWTAPDLAAVPANATGDSIRYGYKILAQTALYFGPKGSIAHLSNGMNCQNCHLNGGSKLFGNNYAVFMANYPKMSFRSGKYDPATKRIADCFTRSLAGHVPDTNGHEVRSMLAYMKWIGQNVKKGDKIFGTSTEKLPYLSIAADPQKGRLIYLQKCKTCHGENGDGIMAGDGRSYIYPPLWGQHSYNDAAGMYRIGNLAGFIKNNMPYGVTWKHSQLSNEQAWHVAAFVNSQPRPHQDQQHDWPNLKNKPIDFPFGPYADNFSAQQHKFGPFNPIKKAQQLNTKN